VYMCKTQTQRPSIARPLVHSACPHETESRNPSQVEEPLFALQYSNCCIDTTWWISRYMFLD